MGTREDGWLIEAAQRGDAAEIRHLLAAGADARARNEHGVTALMVAVSVVGVDPGLVGMLAARSDLEARPEKSADRHEKTALLCAALAGSAEVVRVLVEAGADIEARDNRGFTPLHTAASGSMPDRDGFGRVDTLLSLGADPEVRDDYSRTPLMNAIMFNRPDACRALLPVSDPRAEDRVGFDALKFARLEAHARSGSAPKAGSMEVLSMVEACVEERLLLRSSARPRPSGSGGRL